ncbi:hypothetical protein EUX98_g5769 [Antrodiella citrinella]|uniref:VWFA domain-containing protein n=1 Tax=Antrodiella citrinella TaxID=2447956 RepID=A0A4S4MQZ2_9APHY|nr:hypothetical protein EUX98_g5769 [Antrodiella citrinella]
MSLNTQNTSQIRRLFESLRPKGLSLMGYRLESLLLYYLGVLEKAKAASDNGDPEPMRSIKPVNYIVITDGFPTDAPEDVIVAAARRLTAGGFSLMQVGIQIVQLGDNPDATEFLRRLDDDLPTEYGCRDIVDTTPYNGQELNEKRLLKILIGAVNGRIDRIQNSELESDSQSLS